MSDQPLSLRRKLFLAGQEAEAVEKKGVSEDGSFNFVRAADLVAEASRVLEQQEVVVIPSVESVEIRFLKNGGAIAKAEMLFEVVDAAEDGESESFTKPWVGTAFDALGDKAAYAAQTGAKKYFLASLLGIPFGIDPEGDGEAKPESAPEAQRIAAEQDAAAERPDVPSPEPVGAVAA